MSTVPQHVESPGCRGADFCDRRVGFAGLGVGDDQVAVFLDDDRPALVFVQVGECRVSEPFLEDAFAGDTT